jgi:hypothetical protein
VPMVLLLLLDEGARLDLNGDSVYSLGGLGPNFEHRGDGHNSSRSIFF